MPRQFTSQRGALFRDKALTGNCDSGPNPETSSVEKRFRQAVFVKPAFRGEVGCRAARAAACSPTVAAVAGVALDKVVRIADSAICLYPSNLFPNGRPEAGAGLNKAALCALYGIFPKRRKGDGTRTQEAFRRKLRSVPNTHFEEYEPETGRWAFRVAAGGWY